MRDKSSPGKPEPNPSMPLTQFEPPGWVTPEGGFFPSERAVIQTGLGLTGHALAAFEWLSVHQPARAALLERSLEEQGFEVAEGAAAEVAIKQFMMEQGFVRLSGDHTEFIATGNINPRQREAIVASARAHEAEVQIRPMK